MIFTVEETNLMCCFDSDIAELVCQTVRKLESMTDAEFDAQYIAPDSMIDD